MTQRDGDGESPPRAQQEVKCEVRGAVGGGCVLPTTTANANPPSMPRREKRKKTRNPHFFALLKRLGIWDRRRIWIKNSRTTPGNRRRSSTLCRCTTTHTPFSFSFKKRLFLRLVMNNTIYQFRECQISDNTPNHPEPGPNPGYKHTPRASYFRILDPRTAAMMRVRDMLCSASCVLLPCIIPLSPFLRSLL